MQFSVETLRQVNERPRRQILATMDLWLEGDWGGGDEHIVWHAVDVPFDLHRYHYDERYANLVTDYVKKALEHLGAEIAEIAMMSADETGKEPLNCD